MIIFKKLKLIKYLTIIAITTLCGQQIFATESKQELLMRGLYEYYKTNDFSDDPEEKKKIEEFKKSYEEMQRRKKY